MTANIVRWVPTGMQRMELRADAPAGAEVWIQDETKFFAIAYSGKRAKHDWYYSFRSRERMIAEIEQWIDGLVRSAANKAAAKVEKQNLARQPHGVTVGDVFCASWGYDQTNIDYYEVIELHGATMVTVRPIGKQALETGWEQGDCVPAPGAFIGEPMRVRLNRSAGTVSIKVRSSGWAYLMSPQVVGGVRVYRADHWTSYA